MKTVRIYFTACVLFHLQPSVQVSTDTSTASWHQTATPDVLTSPSPDLVPRCEEMAEFFSCRNKCEKRTQWDETDSLERFELHCHCDQACLKYRDCCADYTRYCQPLSPAPQEIKNANYTCIKTSTLEYVAASVFMISNCAADWKDKEVRSKCLAGTNAMDRNFSSANILEGIPVAFKLTQGLHYRNIYCGICNNVKTMLLVFWELKFQCKIKPPQGFNSTQTLEYILKNCPTRVVSPTEHFKIRTCIPMVSSCSIENQTEHKDGCLKGTSGIVFLPDYENYRNKVYKNYHCVLCNGLSLKEASCHPPFWYYFNYKSFEIVMQFKTPTSNQKKTKVTKVSSTCPPNKVYDQHLKTCVTGNVSNSFKANKYRLKFWMRPLDGRMKPVTTHQFSIALCKKFALDPSKIEEIVISSEDNSIAVAFSLYAGTSFRINDETNMPYKDNLNVSIFLNFNKSFEININDKTWEVIRVTERQLACVETIMEFSPGDFKILTNGGAFLNKTVQKRSVYHFFVDYQGTKYSTLLVCKSNFTIQCPFVLLQINPREYTMLANKTLLHNTTGRVYPLGKYDLNGEKAVICANYTNYMVNYTNSSIQVIEPNITTKTESRFMRYVTLVGFSVSVLALILTLVIHFIFAELRRPLPGKNLMSLCLALALAQFMWLFGSGDTDKPTFCTAVAAVIHYLFLVSFACMAIIAFDTHRTFSGQISRAPGISIGGQNKNIRFLKYTCLSWGLPMLFVGGCVLLDHFQVVFIGYGNEDACWLVSSDGKIIVFAVPIASVLLYNIGAFSHTIWAINSARKQTTRVTSARQDQKVVLKIYLRLVTLMGFTWFFSFGAELIHKVLIYPFVVLTTTQAVFIFVAFVCKTTVLKLIRNSFSRSRGVVLAPTPQVAIAERRNVELAPTQTTAPKAFALVSIPQSINTHRSSVQLRAIQTL